MQKQAIVEGSKPKHIDLELPGWGEWGGHGVVPTLHKKKRWALYHKLVLNTRWSLYNWCIHRNVYCFSRMFETTPTPKRRDSSLGNVIINEKADDKLKPYLVIKLLRVLPHFTYRTFSNGIIARYINEVFRIARIT